MPIKLYLSARRPRMLPWELLQHIYSFCDVETLVALSLLSFGSWELAGPILYEHVDITSLDALKSLFFLDGTPASERMNASVPLLSRIKSLRVEIDDWEQASSPFFPCPPCGKKNCFAEHYGRDPDWTSHLLPPHRLWRALGTAASTLPINKLILSREADDTGIFELLCSQLFPHLNPRSVIHAEHSSFKLGLIRVRWKWDTRRFDDTFFEDWTALERIVHASSETLCRERLPDAGRGTENHLPIYAFWLPPPPPPSLEAKRSLEMAFDLTAWSESFKEAFRFVEQSGKQLGWYLDRCGVQKKLVSQVELTATVTVSAAEEYEVSNEIARCETWMQDLIVVKTV